MKLYLLFIVISEMKRDFYDNREQINIILTPHNDTCTLAYIA